MKGTCPECGQEVEIIQDERWTGGTGWQPLDSWYYGEHYRSAQKPCDGWGSYAQLATLPECIEALDRILELLETPCD
jgi:hypothetical protein